jgi:hypothetical protein
LGCPAAKGFRPFSFPPPPPLFAPRFLGFFFPFCLRPVSVFLKQKKKGLRPVSFCLRPVSFFPYLPPYFCPLFKRSFSLSIYIYSGVPNTVFDKKIAFEFLQKLEPPKK